MAADDKIIIEFDGDIKALKGKLKSSQKEVSNLRKAASFTGEAISKSAGVAAVALGGITAAVTGAVNEARKFETITTQFEVLTGSVESATATVKNLQNFAATTPFQFEGISKAAQQLLGFGFSAEQLVPKLQEIGDVASAVGAPIEEVGFIFGQVAAAGKLTGERLLQFQERAIPIGPAIAKTMGVAEESVKDLVSKGKVDLDTFQKAFASLSKEGGFAFGGMIKQSKTFAGLLSTVADNVSLLAADLGQELLPAAKGVAQGFLDMLQEMRKTDNFVITAVKYWGKILTDSFTTTSEERKQSLQEVNTELKELDAQIKRVEKSIEEGKDSVLYNSFLGRAKQDMEEYGELLARKTELEKEQQEISKRIDQEELDRKKEKAEKERQQLAADAKTKKEEELARRQQDEIEFDEVEAEIREREKQSLAMHEEELRNIQKGRIQNVNEAKRAVAREDLKAEAKENDLRMKEEVRYGKDLAAARAFFRSKEVEGVGMMLDNLATLGRSGNKQLVAIAKAAAISRAVMNTAAGVTQALGNFPPPLSFALAGSVAAAGAVQIATIKKQGFARGGLVEGGIPGIDSVPALMQQGEVVAPRQNFEEVIGSVRAKREAEKLGEGVGGVQSVEVELSFKDNVGEFIEGVVLERRALGTGAI